MKLRTYCGANAGSQIERVLWNAEKSAWVISPWIGKDYARRLVSLSENGVEVRIITTNVDFNAESTKILRTARNTNLRFLVMDKERTGLIHAKIYVVDDKYAISGSANLTFSGLHSNLENLIIAETQEEVQKIRSNFTDAWMSSDMKSMSSQEPASENSYSLKTALPLANDLGDIGQNNIADKALVYHPYYFFEFGYRVSVGTSPPCLFENRGLVVLDAVSREVMNDKLLSDEIGTHLPEDYVLRTNAEYRLRIDQPIIHDLREARELVLSHIIDKNTQYYRQVYRSGSYDRIFVPYPSIIRFIRSGFVQVPIWYLEIIESENRHYENVVFGASAKKWTEFIYCPDCQERIWVKKAISCQRCGTKVCPDCIEEKGFIFTKRLCQLCASR